MEEKLFDVIAEMCANDPISVWLLRSNENGDMFDQFVKPNGVLYWTESLHNKIKNLALRYNEKENCEELLTNCFTVSSVAAHYASRKNTWKSPRRDILEDIMMSCLEYYHGGLWNTKYNRENMISVDMVACYPASFLGYGAAEEYFKRFGHPRNEMTRVYVNGPLPDFDLTGFAKVMSFEFNEGLHPCFYIWIGRHMIEKLWLPIILLRYMTDCGMLKLLIISEMIISYGKQTDVWLPTPESFDKIVEEFREHMRDVNEEEIIDWSKKIYNQRKDEAKDLGRKIIGKFTQGGKNYDYRRYSSRLITDSAEYDFIIKDVAEKK